MSKAPKIPGYNIPSYTCDVCKKKILDLLHRWHCLECSNFDICVNCFSKKSFSGTKHTSSHALQEICPCQLIVIDNLEVKAFRCNSCKTNIGNKSPRYHCQECFDVDICGDCYKTENFVKGHLNTHKLQLYTYSTGIPYPDGRPSSPKTDPVVVTTSPSKAEHAPSGKYTDIPIELISNPLGGVNFNSNSLGTEVTFSFDQEAKKRTVFIDKSITEGIYHLLGRIRYGKGQVNSAIDFGVAASDLLKLFQDSTLGELSGSCCFSFGLVQGQCLSFLDGVPDKEKAIRVDPEGVVTDGALVGAELNVTARTLSFFVDGRKHTNAISNVVGPVNFGVDGAGHSTFTAISLRRLSAATPSDVKNVFFEMKKR